MSEFTQSITELQLKNENYKKIKEKVDSLSERLNDLNEQYVVMLEAQKLLATVSNDNTTLVLDYITGVINKTLKELFPYDTPRIFLERVLHAGQHAHIKVKLTNSEGRERDMVLQTGTGVRQVVSFLFVISLIEIRKSRRLLVMDELLSGLHPEAKKIICDIIHIFAEEGFQFVLVEYGINYSTRTYLVEKPDKVATVTLLEGAYHDEVFVFNRPKEEIDMNYIEDYDTQEEEINSSESKGYSKPREDTDSSYLRGYMSV